MEECMKAWLKNWATNIYNVSLKDNLVTQVIDFLTDEEN